MSALGIHDIDDDIESIDNRDTNMINPGRTRNNSLTDSIKDELIKTKQKNAKTQFSSANSANRKLLIEKPVLLNHVNLTLNFINKKANVLPTWKYSNVRKKPVNKDENINHTKEKDSRDEASKKYFQNSFFLTSSNQIDSFESSLNNSENTFKKSEYRVKSGKSNKSPPEYEQRQTSNSSSDSDSVYNVSSYQNNQTRPYQQVNLSSAKPYIKPKFGNLYLDTNRMNGSSVSSCDSARSSGRHMYSIAEFNRFKNNLLKSSHRLELDYKKQQVTGIQPTVKTNGVPPSTIKSIYDAIERDKRIKTHSVDARRSNYLNTIFKTQNFLSNSLIIKKI